MILVVVALSLLATPVAGQAAGQPGVAGETGDGSVGVEATGDANDSLAGETINLHVANADGPAATFSFEVTDAGRIEGLDRGARDDATVEMRTDRQTFERVAHAPNPERAFRAAVEQGHVETRVADDADDAEWDVFDDVEELARSLGL